MANKFRRMGSIFLRIAFFSRTVVFHVVLDFSAISLNEGADSFPAFGWYLSFRRKVSQT